jgi:hypothetical protein
MEEMKKDMGTNQQHPAGCSCKMCGCGCGHGRHMILRWVLGLVILLIVFWVGVKVGEFKTSAWGYGMGYYGGMHRGMMMRRGGYPQMYPMHMMTMPTSTTTPAK